MIFLGVRGTKSACMMKSSEKKDGALLGVIPARGGSKGIPGKNIRPLNGIPLVARAVACAQRARCLDHFIVSTDSKDIRDIAIQAGADVPFLRPPHLADDGAPMLPVLKHALEACEKQQEQRFEYVIIIDPTAPMRRPEDLDEAFTRMLETDAQAVISGHPAHRHPAFNMVTATDSGRVLMADRSLSVTRRQDAPAMYDLNTVAWVYRRSAIVAEERLPQNTVLYMVPPERAFDLDTPLDWKIVEGLLREEDNEETRVP